MRIRSTWIRLSAISFWAIFDTSEFRGKRLSDFGCGSGASTLCLGAMLPDTEVVGVELNPRNIELARRVLAVRQLSNVQFLVFGPEQPTAWDRLHKKFIAVLFRLTDKLWGTVPSMKRRPCDPQRSCITFPRGRFLITAPHKTALSEAIVRFLDRLPANSLRLITRRASVRAQSS